jgi:beta-phosphoglucomutase-like phosphatase (HAD superfamily)
MFRLCAAAALSVPATQCIIIADAVSGLSGNMERAIQAVIVIANAVCVSRSGGRKSRQAWLRRPSIDRRNKLHSGSIS